MWQKPEVILHLQQLPQRFLHHGLPERCRCFCCDFRQWEDQDEPAQPLRQLGERQEQDDDDDHDDDDDDDDDGGDDDDDGHLHLSSPPKESLRENQLKSVRAPSRSPTS